MFEKLADRIPFKKIIVVLAIVFAISLGLCGVTFGLASTRNSSGDLLFGLGVLEVIALGVSLAGLVLTLLVFVTLSIFGAFEEKVSQSVVPSKEADDTKTDSHS